MFIRTKRRGNRTYLQVVENYRENGRVKQRVQATLGRLDVLKNTGQLDQLMVSMQRFSDKLAVIGACDKVHANTGLSRRIGPALIFERLWRELGIGAIIKNLTKERKFEFSVERAIFVTVLHRLFCPGSDRQAHRWKAGYRIEGGERLDLQHFYRAMGWLGTPLPDSEQDGATPFSPRCNKDRIEEALFAKGRDLFSSLELVFFDTTSIYFEGRGGNTLGQYGHSKDHRPDLRQMVVGMVLDNAGRPVCSELWPGNTADVKSLIPIAQRLRRRFHVGNVCIVADRGMISGRTMEQLEEEGWSYILGVRMRRSKEAREQVLATPGRYREVVPSRKHSCDPSPLKVKETTVNGRRYVICLNEEQAAKDRHDREAIIQALEEALKRGDKSLVGNKGYRRFLRQSGRRFSIDREKIAEEERYDGKWVLTTNTDLDAVEVARKYKQLWMVENIFRTMKSPLETRPVFHKCDETIRGHVWCSFLALLLRKELQDRLAEEGSPPEWYDIVRGLDNLVENDVFVGGKHYLVCSQADGVTARVFRACGVALPPQVRQLEK